MQTEPAFTETDLARRWNVSIKTLQRWRSEERGPPYIKLSKAIRYPVDEIVTYEQAIRQGMSNEAPLPSLSDAQPVVRILPHGTRRRHRADVPETAGTP